MYKTKTKVGFTLAEVLITLAIIGVVAAMTIPTLISKYQEKQTVTHLTKIYSTLSQAWQLMQTDYGTIDTWGLVKTVQGYDSETQTNILDYSAQKILSERLFTYLKYAELSKNANDIPTIWLADGSAMTFGHYNGDSGDVSVWLSKKGYEQGKDRYFFTYSSKGLIPEGYQGATVASFETYCRKSMNYSRGCTAWIIYNKNMDYLYCDDLSWYGKHSCKD